jgi:hypothetical protein
MALSWWKCQSILVLAGKGSIQDEAYLKLSDKEKVLCKSKCEFLTM